MSRFFPHLSVPTLFLVLLTAFAGDGARCLAASTAQEPGQVAQGMEERYRQIESLSFSFFQKSSGQLAGRPKEGKGNGVFAKTDAETLMRWNYLAPDYQVVISDGKSVSMYFEKLNQMIVSPVDAVQTDVLFSFFTGDMPLAENFQILPPDEDRSAQSTKQAGGLQVIKLRPLQPQSQINSIHLWVTDDSLIRRIEFLDHFDTRTVINLSNIQINPIDTMDRDSLRSLFTFSPPEGTEIIRQ